MIRLFSSMSESSTIEELPPQHQVYINSHGDVRSGFVSDLVNALNRNNINVVLDEDEGKDHDSRVLKECITRNKKSINESKFAIVIFSGTYTESRRVLKDLKSISECMKKDQLVVIPIFYRMDPSTVKDLRGQFGDAFRVRFGNIFIRAGSGKALRVIGEKVPIRKKCEEALKSISEKDGFTVEKGRNEYKKVEKIVEMVKTKLEKIHSDRRPKDKTIAIIKRLKELGKKLNLSKIKSQLGLISSCLMLLFLVCFQHTAYTKCGEACGGIARLEGQTELLRGNVTQFDNSTSINPQMCCPAKPPQIQVFINFRGAQVRNIFICYLVDALMRRGVNYKRTHLDLSLNNCSRLPENNFVETIVKEVMEMLQAYSDS